MPDAQCVRYPIKPGQRDALVNWVARLKHRSAEVTEVLAEVGLIAEAVFMERSDHGDYLLIYTSAKNLRAANEALSSSQLSLVREFDQLMAETVDMEQSAGLELLYHTP
jgi:Family of unknown function (DUF6176)